MIVIAMESATPQAHRRRGQIEKLLSTYGAYLSLREGTLTTSLYLLI